MKGGLLLDVVIGKSTTILELLASEDQPLLVWRDPLLVLDLALHVLDGVRSLHLKGDGLTSESFHENLHPTTKTEHQMKGGFLLDVVVRQGTAILELLASKDQPLLVWGDAFFVLDLRLDILNGVRSLNFQSDGFSSESLHENLHSTTETEHQVKGGLLLDVVVRQGTTILKLLAGKDQPLLVWGDAFLVLDLALHVLDGVRSLHLKGDGLTSEGLDKDLHTTTKTEHQVKGGLLLDVVVRQGTAILELLASKDQPLLVWRDPLFVLDLRLDILDGIRGLYLQGDGLTSEGLDKDLHLERVVSGRVFRRGKFACFLAE